MISLSKLCSFEDERFYGLLDVALDIRGELDFSAQDIVIPLMRHLVRYTILLPASTISMMDRYCELRWKALKFLESESYIDEPEHLDSFSHRWESSVRVAVSNKVEFYEMVVLLGEEEERRDPGTRAPDLPSAMVRVEQLCNSFQAVALRLKPSYGDRPGFDITNEYDVQHLLGGLLETRFSDIRAEVWTPNYAGKASRTDFLLQKEAVLVETKMTRDGLTDGKLGDQLIIDIDIDRYKKYPNCKALFCFVYDPDHRLKNPRGIEADLSRKTDGLLVRVRIRPIR